MSKAIEDISAYVSASISDEIAVHKLRDKLYERVGLGTEYRLSDAHITILPSFEIPRDYTHALDKKLAELDLEGRTVEIHGVGIWPNVQNPRVVLLDCTIDLSDEREELLDVLRDIGVRDLPEPVKPHITLFKCDNGYILEDERRKKILEEVAMNRESWETTIQYVDLVRVD